jgi:hypothetical protein
MFVHVHGCKGGYACKGLWVYGCMCMGARVEWVYVCIGASLCVHGCVGDGCVYGSKGVRASHHLWSVHGYMGVCAWACGCMGVSACVDVWVYRCKGV